MITFRVTVEGNEEFPVYSLDTHLDGASNRAKIDVTPDEFYTALIYENLRDQAQDYIASFKARWDGI